MSEADYEDERDKADEIGKRVGAIWDTDAIAVALAQERGKARAETMEWVLDQISKGAQFGKFGVGRCGAESPRMGSLATSICALPAGHAGWHREGTTEWGIRRAAEASS